MSQSISQIIVTTHGSLAQALGQTLELIAGPQPAIAYLPLAFGDDVQVYKTQIAAAITPDRATLIMVDLPGGTPWNVAVSVANEIAGVRVVSGVNLSMLLEVCLSRQGLAIDQLTRIAEETGREAIRVYG
ncbi:MAG: PTS sugar transporter subunit IIA [Chloroflexi bacterium]|nr:PTS sugar transporter subunit IIA [Chloroflexota bacterium]MCL5275936.1 PTS sugar transporter subunit IIA [Chloroflexota bacterium]